MSKRWTWRSRWKDSWFRSLNPKQKVVWDFLWDECDSIGLIRNLDFEMASFQLGFKLDPTVLPQWFGSKIFVFSDKILLLPFYYEQYSETKDSWSAKVKASETLTNLGFIIQNNQIIIPENYTPPTVVPLCTNNGGTPLSISKGNKNRLIAKNFENEINDLFENLYPKKEGQALGVARLLPKITTESDLSDLKKAIENYIKKIKKDRIKDDYIIHFHNFALIYKDFLKPNFGKVVLNSAPAKPAAVEQKSHIDNGSSTLSADDVRAILAQSDSTFAKSYIKKRKAADESIT
jgi:hypothetical protein